MSEVIEPLILDLLEWIAGRPRTYAEVMEAWRTSCPRLTVWEEAAERGLLVREHAGGNGRIIRLTANGERLLREQGRLPAQSDALRVS